jgi:malate dehydrogenase (oxaloacetate-decarboxylating)
LKLVNKKIEEIRVVANGAGSAGVAIVKLLLHMGVKDVILCDTKGIIYEGRPFEMNPFKEEMAHITNKEQEQNTLADALVVADVFVGVSAPGVVTKEIVRSMNHHSIIFAMSNPVPEIIPEVAKEAGVLVVGKAVLIFQIRSITS